MEFLSEQGTMLTFFNAKPKEQYLFHVKSKEINSISFSLSQNQIYVSVDIKGALNQNIVFSTEISIRTTPFFLILSFSPEK